MKTKISYTDIPVFETRGIILDECTIDALLAINTRNRHLNRDRITAFSNAMETGHWDFSNPNSMTFTVNRSMSWLIDGQTRLNALKNARIFTARGRLDIVDDDDANAVFASIDTGRPRKLAATMALEGLKNASLVVSAVRNYLAVIRSDNSVPKEIVRAFIGDNPIAVGYFGCPRTFEDKKVSASVIAGFINAVRLGVPSEYAKEFLSRACLMTSPDDYTRKAHKCLMERICGGNSQIDVFFRVCKCVVSSYKKRPMQKLFVTENDIKEMRSPIPNIMHIDHLFATTTKE